MCRMATLQGRRRAVEKGKEETERREGGDERRERKARSQLKEKERFGRREGEWPKDG